MINRIKAIDWMRGLIMILMALDHTSLYWNQGRIQDEGFQGFYPAIPSCPQFLTRFISHICAPAFLLIAGLMMSFSLLNRLEKGRSDKALTLHFMFRGLSLIAIDFLIINRMSLTFGILACIGSCMILLTFIRFLPITLILLLSATVLMLHPWIDFSWILEIFPQSSYFVHILCEPIRQKSSWSVFYPVIPWVGVMGLGFCLGKMLTGKMVQEKKQILAGFLISLGVCILFAFLPVRLVLGKFYGDSPFFWLMSKYPPSLSFLLWNLGLTFLLLGETLWWEGKRSPTNRFLNALAVYGRVPLFFYILHRYIYGFIPNITHTRGGYSLALTYVVWLIGLISLYFLCRAYGKFIKRLKSRDKDSQR
jgi:uncharacterized membrane protein